MFRKGNRYEMDNPEIIHLAGRFRPLFVELFSESMGSQTKQ